MSKARTWGIALALAAACMMLLTACGGGGGDGAQRDLEAQLAALEAEKALADAALAAEREARQEAEEEVDDLADRVEALEDNDTTRRPATAATGSSHPGLLLGLPATADDDTTTGATGSTTGTTGTTTQQRSTARQAEDRVRAGPYIAAINDGGTARGGVTVTYMRGSTLMINPGGNFETGTGAPAISGFTARRYTRDVGVNKQTVDLYTNIQAPGTRAFWKLHGLMVEDADDDTAQKPTPTGSPQFIPHATDNTMSAGVRVSGTYDGVSGTYTCDTDTSCAGTRTAITLADFVATTDGVRSFTATGDWDFKPSSITSGVQQPQDTEHLYFGIWVEEPDTESATHSYQYITGGSLPAFTAVDTLTGTARFSGGAVGKYVTRNQVGETPKVGTFTAAANLTAVFGASPTLEGRISNFRDGGQSLAGWSVYLGATGNVPAEFASGTVTDGLATGRIGGVSATGMWDAVLHGTANADLGGTTDYPYTRYPRADLAGVVGNFHATDSTTAPEANVAIAGAFAATPSN